MSDTIRVPASLRRAPEADVYHALKARFPNLILTASERGVLTELVLQAQGALRVLTVIDDPQEDQK